MGLLGWVSPDNGKYDTLGVVSADNGLYDIDNGIYDILSIPR
jgi:hypothetical protein